MKRLLASLALGLSLLGLAGWGGTTVSFPPVIPSYATAFGFTHFVVAQQFNTLSIFDLAQTQLAGKLWYTKNVPSYQGSPVNAPANPAWYSTDGISVTISSNNAFDQGSENLGFAYVSATPPKTVGPPTIPGSGGFYIEGKMEWNLTCGSGQTFIPDFWMEDLNGYVSQIENTTIGTFDEIDIFEGCSSATANSTVQTVVEWTGPSTNAFARSTANLTGVDMTKSHTWGALVVPMAKNGGTGEVCWYVDHVQTGSCVTWTSTSQFGANIENGNFEINFAAGVNTPLKIEYIYVVN